MPTLNLKNITIQKKQGTNFKDYYLIVDKDTDQAYFCFSGAVKEGWQDLITDYENIKEVEVEFEVNDRGERRVMFTLGVFLIRK